MQEEGTPISSEPQSLQLPIFDNVADSPDRAGRQHDADFELHFLALSQLRGIGERSLRVLIDNYGSLERVWSDDVRTIQEILAGARVPNSQTLAEQIRDSRPGLLSEGRRLQEYLHKRSTQLIAWTDPLFPPQLREIPDAPYWLFVEGDPHVLTAGSFVAVVGTRESSDVGRATAEQITWLNARMGLGLVSGLAEGIDAHAHALAARHSIPQVAVLGTGINIIFPQSTAAIRRHIVESGGCVITEYMPNDNYGKSRFVQRNRIQAGLSSAVCPVEGRSQSGTMHTVRFAAKYQRPLFTAIRGQASEINDMPAVLTDMGAPVFDIKTADGKTALKQFLEGLQGKRFPVPPRPDPAFLFRNVIRSIESLITYDEPTEDEKDYLIKRIEELLNRPGSKTE